MIETRRVGNAIGAAGHTGFTANGRDHPVGAGGCNPANDLIRRIGDVKICLGIHGQSGRARKARSGIRAVLIAIFYLRRTDCQWRLLPREFPPCGTVYHYFRAWQNSGVWVHLHRVLYEQARRHAGREACPSVVIMDGQSVKTTERGGARGFDAHKRVKGRKRHILVDTIGLPVANRVEPANTSDRRAGALLLGGLSALFPRIRTVIADAGLESRKLARTLKQHQGWQLRIV